MLNFLAPIMFLAAGADAAPIDLHVVPVPARAPRLLGMSMDEDGCIWFGSTHRFIYRYDPRAGGVQDIKLPFDSSTSQCLCVGKKVYLLGQSYPKLMIYDRATKRFSERAYPSLKPDVWYGIEPFDGRNLYLFDRGGAGLIKWDSTDDQGTIIPCPYKVGVPSGGRYVAADQAIYCMVWDYSRGQYDPIGIARFDTRTDRFTDWFAFPKEDSDLKPYTDPTATLFYPFTLKGKLVPFDFREKRWCKSIHVPGYGERFGFIGLATVHDSRWCFSLSTYNGTEQGCDGKPYHFCNSMLVFDPKTGAFDFPTLNVPGKYYQVSYALSAGGHLFATGNNIREADGTLNAAKTGDAVVWQTMKTAKKK